MSKDTANAPAIKHEAITGKDEHKNEARAQDKKTIQARRVMIHL